MNLEGKILGNRYEIIEKIGNGGMAQVYRAKCHVLKREVAVKVLRDEFTTDEEFIKRFNIEAQSVASLTHPNIVSVYDVGHEGNLYYIVMELVKGKTLKEIIVEDGVLGWKWSVKIAIQVASALEKAHQNNIIHRDIKPHNIIITEEGVAKVMDFGIAKAVSNATITAFGATIGSVHYFSPEHAKGGVTDAKSDLYSLGVVMYEMVTGKLPFDADTPVSVALKHMQEEAVPPDKVNPDVPRSVSKIIMKAMQKDVNLRYQSATEMKADLEKVLKDPEAVTGVLPQDFKTRRIDTKAIQEEAKKTTQRENTKNQTKFAKLKEYFEKHKAVKTILIIFFLILVFILSMAITFFALNKGKPKNVQIPNLLNLTMEEAKQEAEKAKLKLEIVEEKYDVEIEEGKIISQEPPYQQNYTVKEGSTIKLIMSKGQEIVIVPKVIGNKKDEAINLLKEKGLEVRVEEEYNDEIEAGIVVKQSLDENAETFAGSEIVVTVSLGIEQVEVPDLLGKTETEAKKIITDAKLKWKETTKVKDSSKPNGVVVSQSISKDSTVDKNTEISIVVNEFEEVKTGEIIVNLKSITGYEPNYEEIEGKPKTLKNPPKKVTLKIILGQDTVFEDSVSEDNEKISCTIQGIGVVQVKVFVDNVLKRQNLQWNLNTTPTWTAK